MNKQMAGMLPIESEHEREMREITVSLDRYFNGDLKGATRRVGFVLLVFPFGDHENARCNYISNGADRSDIAKMLRDQANRMDDQTQQKERG